MQWEASLTEQVTKASRELKQLICLFLCPRSIPAVPNLFGTRDLFHERQFSMDQGLGDGFEMIQVHNFFFFELYSYYYYISATSDHQALDPRSWGSLIYNDLFKESDSPMVFRWLIPILQYIHFLNLIVLPIFI